MKKPVIGVTLDFEDNKKYSEFPYYALRENYIRAIEINSATALLLPFLPEDAEQFSSIIDGLIITGGNFDISPDLYGSKDKHEATSLKEERTAFEWQITEKAIEKKLPILGICGGMQLLNVILGGDLIQHIPDHIEDPEEHESKPYDAPAHRILIEENSKLSKLSKALETNANSSHHQAVNNLGQDLIASALAPDGVIEAIESINYPFMVGVQWHPEYQITELDKNLFKAFVKACRG